MARAARSIARAANARNNAMHQGLRLERWTDVRDHLWRVLDPLLEEGASVALVGAGSCDDVPLRRITARAARVDLVDFDRPSMERGRGRVERSVRGRIRLVEGDVTDGCADTVLAAVRDDAPMPNALPLPVGPLGSGDYDVVVGDLLYTQLLHAGLVDLGVVGDRQRDVMARYDLPLATSLVQRIQASLAPDGHAVHLHDVACWTDEHPQPLTLEAVLEAPDELWTHLRRHDRCDPHLVLERLRADVLGQHWWPWRFEPAKQFLVRATVATGTPAPA